MFRRAAARIQDGGPIASRWHVRHRDRRTRLDHSDSPRLRHFRPASSSARHTHDRRPTGRHSKADRGRSLTSYRWRSSRLVQALLPVVIAAPRPSPAHRIYVISYPWRSRLAATPRILQGRNDTQLARCRGEVVAKAPAKALRVAMHSLWPRTSRMLPACRNVPRAGPTSETRHRACIESSCDRKPGVLC
jgi:hypothetical protein